MFTLDQILALAPDPDTAKRGSGLANNKHWLRLGHNGRMLWGECVGSGSAPYQCGIDLEGPAFKCNCPVKKFPCKHALGLFLLYASVAEVFGSTQPPQWMAAWIEKRGGNTQTDDIEVPETDAPEADASQAKKLADKAERRAKRFALMGDGVKELERWLGDLFREGLASASVGDWDRTARSLIDNKLPGPAYAVREMGEYNADGNMTRLLYRAGDLYLLVKAFQQIEALDGQLQEELLNQLGVTRRKVEVLEEPAVADEWQVLGVLEGTNLENIRYRRTWLTGLRTGRYALFYDYAFGSTAFEQHYTPGTAFHADLCFYPGAFPLRAVAKDLPRGLRALSTLPFPGTVSDMLDTYAQALGQNPWLPFLPVQLGGVVPVLDKGDLFLVDAEKRMIPVHCHSGSPWELLARSGGAEIYVFGEWDGLVLEVF